MKRLFFSLVFLLQVSICTYSQASWNVIPKAENTDSRYALVIGNENYQTYADRYTEDVLHAIYDAEKFKNAIERNKLVSKKNCFFYADAVNTNIKLLLNRISKLRSQDKDINELIFYFNGKVSYDEEGTLYMIPIDATENQLFFSLSIDELCERIKEAGIKKSWIFIDASRRNERKNLSLLESPGSQLQLAGDLYKGVNIYLPSGESWRSTGSIEEGRMESEDYIAPKLEIYKPVAGESSTSEVCLVEGRATDESGIFTVAVNGEEAHLDIDGTFRAKILLSEGKNEILVEAFDEYHNLKNHIIPFFYIPKEESNISTDVEATVSFYAVLIAINQYIDPLVNDLDGPINDLTKLGEVLVDQYNFKDENILKLFDSNTDQIMDTLNFLEGSLYPDDNLILVFSGHGIWDETTRRGYWLAANADARNNQTWICNSDITSMVSKLPTQHTLIIADACFSGGIFRTRGLPTEAGFDILKKYESPSRNAMTSGDLKEVPDNSSFMFYLLKFLKENIEKYQTAEQLYYKLKIPVMESTQNIPQFGKIKNSGDQGGDFVFLNLKSENK